MARRDKKLYRPMLLDDVINMEKWGAEHYAHIQEVYTLFDKDNDGAIASRDVIRGLRSLGHNPTEQEVKRLLEEFDPEGNESVIAPYMCVCHVILTTGEGIIEFATFLQLLDRVKHHGDSHDEIDEAFRVFDPSDSGLISSADLRHVLTQLGEKLSEEEAEDMIAFADGSSKGEIHWRDLMRTLLQG